MITVNKTIHQKDGTLVPFEYEVPESVEEALQVLGEHKVMQAIRYTLSVVERKRALAPPPTPRGLRKLLRMHPDKVEEILQKAKEVSIETESIFEV